MSTPTPDEPAPPVKRPTVAQGMEDRSAVGLVYGFLLIVAVLLMVMGAWQAGMVTVVAALIVWVWGAIARSRADR